MLVNCTFFMFMDNYDEYFRVAKMLTDIHAKKKIIQKDNNNDKSNKEKNEKIKNKDNNEDMPNNASNNKDNNCENNINVNEEKKMKKIVIMTSKAKMLK